MNVLAHIYLSGDSDKIIIGNYIGDYVKGRDYLKLSRSDTGKELYFTGILTDLPTVIRSFTEAKYFLPGNIINIQEL